MKISKILFKKNTGIVVIITAFTIVCLLFVRAIGMQSIFSDGAGYYSYLPAIFIDHDLSRKTLFEETKNIATDYLARHTIDENTSIYRNAYTVGVAVMEVPFFLSAHAIASIVDTWPADGISWPYQISVFFAQVFYACLGLIFTYKLLRKYYSEQISLISTATVAFATGLIFYAAFGGSFSHAFSFSAVTGFLYMSIQAHEYGKLKYHLITGMLLGLVTCCRVINIVFVLFYVLYGIDTKESFLSKLHNKKLYIQFLVGFLGFLAVFSLQMAYWKYAYGSFLTNSYGAGGTFSWLRPHILEVLVSAARGLFIWHPVFVLAAVGLPYLKERMGIAKLGIWLSILVYVYVTAAWDMWWYGTAFGQRTFTDALAMAAILIAAAVSHFSNCVSGKRAVFRKTALYLVIAVAMIYNLEFAMAFQLGKYQSGLDHSYSDFYQCLWTENMEKINNRSLFLGAVGETKRVNLKWLPHKSAETGDGLLSEGPGSICYGPYVWAFPGTYVINVQYSIEAGGGGGAPIGSVSVGSSYGKNAIAKQDLPINTDSVEFEIHIDCETDLVEVVVRAEVEGVLLRGYTVTRIE